MFFSMMVDIILHMSTVSFFTLMFRCVNINLCIRIKVFGDADFNFLGISINKHVKWNNHINKIANNIARTNVILNRLKHVLAPGILVNIYNCLVWGYERTRIVKVQKKSLRAISSAKYDAHTEPLFRNCNLLNIEDNIHKTQQFKLFYKFTH